jgi:hypothetical protein
MKTEKTDQNFLIRLSVFIRGKKKSSAQVFVEELERA